MSSGPDSPPSPAGRGPSQADDGSRIDKGGLCEENQLELQRSDRSGGNQTSANQQPSVRGDGEHSENKHFTSGKSDQAGDRSDGQSGACRVQSVEGPGGSTSPGVDSYIRGGVSQAGDVVTTAIVSLEATPGPGVDSYSRGGVSQAGDVITTAIVSLEATPERPPRKRDKKASQDLKNIDYSGHFKINIISRDKTNKLLNMKIEEEIFVKFCHLFSCDVQLCVVKEALQSDLKLDVTRGGYPPTLCTLEPGTSYPLDVTMKSFLKKLCYQLSVFNISAIPWNIDQVKNILSNLASYQEGIVIGYEVSGDEATNYWLVGERGSMKSVIEVLSTNLSPRSVSVQQSSQNQDMEHSSGDGSSSNDQQERFRQTENIVPQPGSAVGAALKQPGTEMKTERTSSDHQTTRQDILNKEHQSNVEQESTDSLRGKSEGSGSDNRHTGHHGSDGGHTGHHGSGCGHIGHHGSGGGHTGHHGSGGGHTGHLGSDGGHTGHLGTDGGHIGHHGSGGGHTGHRETDGRHIGHHGSDGGHTHHHGSDGGHNGHRGSDGGHTDHGEADGGHTGHHGSDGGHTGHGEADGGHTGHRGSDGGHTGHRGSDGGHTSNHGSDSGHTGHGEADGRHTGHHGSGDRNKDPTGPSKGKQQEGMVDTAEPSLEGQQEIVADSSQQFTVGLQKGIHDPSHSISGDGHESNGDPRPMATHPTIVGHREGMDGNIQHRQPTGGNQSRTVVTRDTRGTDSQRETGNLQSVRYGEEEDWDIPFADSQDNLRHQQYLSGWSGQNVNSPPQGSASAPLDQHIDRCQGQTDVHRGPGGAPTGGQNVQAHTRSGPSPSRDGHYKQYGEVLFAKDDEHQETKTFFTKDIKLGRLEYDIVSCLPLLEDLRHKFPHIEIQWQKGRHVVYVTGDEVDVKRVTSEIKKYLKAVKDNKVEINSEHMKQEALNMFRESSVLEFVRNNTSSQKVACYLTWNENTGGVYLWIYASDSDIDKAVKLVTSSIMCRKFEVDSGWRLFLDSEYVQQELTDLEKEYNGKVTITLQKNAVTLSCTTDIEDIVLTTVNRMKEDFLTEGIKAVYYTPHGDLTVELCTKVLQNDIQMIEEKFGVQCQPVKRNGKQGWKVKGPKGTLEEASDALREFCARVKSNCLQIQDKTTEDFFKTQPGQNYMASVGENTKCLVTCFEQEVPVTQENLEGMRSGQPGLVQGPERSETGSTLAGRQWRSADGLAVALYCGDGRKSTSDVLVRLTQNEGAQGVTFQSYQEKVAVSLNLPEWGDGEKQEKDKIRKSFESIVIEALEKNYTSLSVLLDDCKQCGWKERKAYILLVKNTLFVLRNRKDCSCAYYVMDQEMFMALRDAIDVGFGSDSTVKITDDKDEIAYDWEHVDESSIRKKNPEIVLHKGELAKMTSEVIVNTTDKQLKLDAGAVSASILKEAGPEIQKECDKYYSGVKYGDDVAITHGYRLKCKHVFHGALPTYSKDHQCKCMKSFLLRCLTEADKKKHSTMSFPALGTGNLGYPRDLVAKTMFDTINNYFKDVKDSSIERVSFVVYPKDVQTVKAFEAEEKSQRKIKGEEPFGATGGVQTRSMTRETNALRQSDENFTKKMYLVVAGKLGEDGIEKAIQQLQNKISDLQKQPTLMTSPLTATTGDQGSTKPEVPPRSYLDKKNGGNKPASEANRSRAQGDKNSPPTNKSTTLEKPEYEARRLVLKHKHSSALEKAKVQAWLEGKDFKTFAVVCPFVQNMEALIIFQSVNDAEKLLRKTGNHDEYIVNEFPFQTVQKLKATLKKSMVETIKKCIKPKQIYEEMYSVSGAEWVEENGTCFLKGSLPEIQCAYRFIVKLTSNGNDNGGRTWRGHTGGDDAGGSGDGTNREDKDDYQGNGQSRQPKPENTDTHKTEPIDNTNKGTDETNRHNIAPRDSGGDTKDTKGQHSYSRSKSQNQTFHDNENVPMGNSAIGDRLGLSDQEDVAKSSCRSVLKHNVDQIREVSGNDKRPLANVGIEHNKQDRKGVSRMEISQQLAGFDSVSETGQESRDTGNTVEATREYEKEERRRLHQQSQLGTSDDMTDKIHYDNAQRFMHDRKGGDGRNAETDNQNVPARDDKVRCSAKTFNEICFFNEGITDDVTKVQFNEDRTECLVTDRNKVFEKAKERLSGYARKEIDNLTKAEQKKFQDYHEKEMRNMDSMRIFCSYDHNINRIQLVGDKYSQVEIAEHSIFTAIGRKKLTDQGFPSMKRSLQERKKSPLGSEVLHTKQGIKVFVYKENILDLPVDAIIHGTNVSLDNSGGLASKIAIAAGPELERACSNTFRQKKKLNIGDCCKTTAGKLHYMFIIHAVIPEGRFYRPHNQQSRQCYQDDLCRAILNSLEEADNAGARSVALPAVGNAHNPTEMCTAAYKEAVILFCEGHQHPTMTEIHFVDQDKDVLGKISEVFQQSKPKATNQVKQTVQRTIMYPVWLARKDAGGTLQLNDRLTVCVIKQQFTDTQAAALVSLEDEQFQSIRYVARAIEKKARAKYIQEKEKIKKNKHRKISDVFHTHAGNLGNVIYVLHVIAPVCDSDISKDPVLWKGVTDTIRACLHQVFRKVDELKLDSVALPSFASGTLQGDQSETLWQICVEEVLKYAKQQNRKSQLDRILLVDASAKTTSYLLTLLDSIK